MRLFLVIATFVLASACGNQPVSLAQSRSELAAKQKLAAFEEVARERARAQEEALRDQENEAAATLAYFRGHRSYIFEPWDHGCYLVFMENSYEQAKGSISQISCDRVRGMLVPSHRAALERYEAELKSRGKAEVELER